MLYYAKIMLHIHLRAKPDKITIHITTSIFLFLKRFPSQRKYTYIIGKAQNIKWYEKADKKSSFKAETTALVIPHPGQGIPKS